MSSPLQRKHPLDLEQMTVLAIPSSPVNRRTARVLEHYSVYVASR